MRLPVYGQETPLTPPLSRREREFLRRRGATRRPFSDRRERVKAPVAAEFQKRDVMVGRPFPPMTQHLRVSVGTQAEMDKFVAAFKEIMATPAKTSAGV